MNPLYDPLFSAAMGLLSANSKSRTPPNYAGGIMNALAGTAQLQQQDQQNQLRQMLLAVQAAKLNRPEKPQVVGAGGALVGPDGKAIYQNPKTTGGSQSETALLFKAAGDPSDPNHEAAKAILKKKATMGSASGGQFSGDETYYQDKDGNWRVGQLSKFGGMIDAVSGQRVKQEDVTAVLPPSQNPALQGQKAEAVGKGTATGTATGEAENKLRDAVAGLPRAEAMINRLNELGEKATYTMAGQTVDAIRRQLDIEPREAAKARAEFESTVKNSIFPLLKETLGTQFTENDRKAMENMLASVDLSPAEKTAQLRAFWNQKLMNIATGQARVGMPQDNLQMAPKQGGNVMRFDANGNPI